MSLFNVYLATLSECPAHYLYPTNPESLICLLFVGGVILYDCDPTLAITEYLTLHNCPVRAEPLTQEIIMSLLFQVYPGDSHTHLSHHLLLRYTG